MSLPAIAGLAFLFLFIVACREDCKERNVPTVTKLATGVALHPEEYKAESK